MRFSFVHAADLHLDTPFEGLGRVRPALAARLRDASLDAFDDLVRLTIDRKAEFLLLAGDIYDGADRGLRAQLRFHRGLKRLATDGVRVFIVHGNHDPLDGWSAIRAWPPNVTVFGADGVRAVPIEGTDGRIATVYGVSYPRRDVRDNLSLQFRRESAPGLHIALLHCSVGELGEHAAYSPCTLDDLRAAGMDYWAIGHVHERRILADGAPWVVYPGSLQGRSPKHGERGAKGAMVIHVEDGAVRQVEFVPCDRVRFLEAVIDVSHLPDLPAVAGACAEEMARLRAAHGGRELVVRTSLVGRGPTYAELRRAGAEGKLLDALRDDVEDGHGGLWCEGLRNLTQPPIDVDAIRRRDDFSAAVLRFADALDADPLRLHGLCHACLGDLDHADVAPVTDTDGQRAVLMAAVDLALGLLEEQDSA